MTSYRRSYERLSVLLSDSSQEPISSSALKESSAGSSEISFLTFLASAKKSIASTVGIGEAMNDVEMENLPEIPLHLRNAANKVMKGLGYGKDHVRYAWMEEKKGKSGSTHSAQWWPFEARVATSSSLGFSPDFDFAGFFSAASQQVRRPRVRSSVRARVMECEETGGAVAVCQFPAAVRGFVIPVDTARAMH